MCIRLKEKPAPKLPLLPSRFPVSSQSLERERHPFFKGDAFVSLATAGRTADDVALTAYFHTRKAFTCSFPVHCAELSQQKRDGSFMHMH